VRQLLFLLAIFLIITIFLLAAGAVVGFLVHRVAPAVDAGTALLTGVVVTGFSVHFFGKLITALGAFEGETDDEVPYIRLYPVKPPRGRRRRKS
jgi:hypothetical protein